MHINLLAPEASLLVQLIDVNRLQDGNPNMPQDAEIADHGGMFVDGPTHDRVNAVDDQQGVII
jgi:hypothetical protein